MSVFVFKGILYTCEFVEELLVVFYALLHLVATVDYGAVVSSSHHSSDACRRHLGVFLCEIDGHLSRSDIVFLAASSVDVCRSNVVMAANALDDVIDSERLLIHFHGAFDDTLGKIQVDVAVIDNAVSHERVDDTMQIAHASVGCRCDELHYIFRNVQAVVAYLASENVGTELHIGLFKFGNESAREACEQAFIHLLQRNRRAVARKDDALAVAEEVVEDVEERVLRSGFVFPLLNIIDNQHVNGLIEQDEVVDSVAPYGVGVLYFEEPCTYLKHPFLWICLLDMHANSVDEVRFTAS